MSKRKKTIETRVIVEPVEHETDDLEALAAALLQGLRDVDELDGGGEAPLSDEEPAA